MKPRAYMWLGVATMAVASAAGLFAGLDGLPVWIAFAGGCLFGKGYGVWEERQRRHPENPHV